MLAHNDSSSYSTNSVTGKKILSLVRKSDYAHPGEEEAIENVLAPISLNSNRRVLDVGSGLGGTAHYIERSGWGSVTGVDIDAEAISFAKDKYPEQEFLVCGAEDLVSKGLANFDLVVSFSALHTFSDQRRALGEMYQVSNAGSQMVISDYYADTESGLAETYAQQPRGSSWSPIQLSLVGDLLKETGWNIEEMVNVTEDYIRWYTELLDRIEQAQESIKSMADEKWYDYVYQKYENLLEVIKQGAVGGIVIYATRIE